jgi:hypothetical protein
MATLYGNTVWEGLSTETKPDNTSGGFDGHFFKEMDTGETYIKVNGVWEYVNLGLAFVKATKSGRVTTDANGEAEIVFTTAFIDNNYSVALSIDDNGATVAIPTKYDRLTTGFKIRTRNPASGQLIGNIGVSWLATRDYDP